MSKSKAQFYNNFDLEFQQSHFNIPLLNNHSQFQDNWKRKFKITPNSSKIFQLKKKFNQQSNFIIGQKKLSRNSKQQNLIINDNCVIFQCSLLKLYQIRFYQLIPSEEKELIKVNILPPFLIKKKNILYENMTILIKDQKYLKDHLILFENREESELNLFQLKVSEQVVKF